MPPPRYLTVPRGRVFRMALGLAVLYTACRREESRNRKEDHGSSLDSATAATHRKLIPLTVLPESFAVCRFDRGDSVPLWAPRSSAALNSITRTGDELSIIVVDSAAPRNVRCEREWRVFKVRGPLPFDLVGIIAGLSGTLANAGISIFALSTFETDYVMVKQGNLGRAERALREAGYPFVNWSPADSARPLTIKPVDEAVTDPDFFLFRWRVQTAVAARDTSEIMRIVDPSILNSFGGDGGPDEFREQWQLKTPEKSLLWVTLGGVLSLGGRFQGDSAFYAPYTSGGTSGDGFEALAVLGSNVPMHAGPGATFKVIDTLSFGEVKKWREKPTTGDWEPVRTLEGRTGWVHQRFLRSPIGYRAGFVRRQGRWWLRALVAGD
jgi:uncharacterized protein